MYKLYFPSFKEQLSILQQTETQKSFCKSVIRLYLATNILATEFKQPS